MTQSQEILKCPVCGARFRGTCICSRCEADLTPLMKIAFKAFKIREEARRALLEGCYEKAQKLAREAQSLIDTDSGRQLYLICNWLTECSVGVGTGITPRPLHRSRRAEIPD